MPCCGEASSAFWVDTHCHLECFEKNATLSDAVARARQAGVKAFVTAGTCPDDWTLYRRLHASFPKDICYTAGLHPQEVSENFEQALKELEPFFRDEYAPCAVGEVGLDYYHLPADTADAQRIMQLQQQAFRLQIRLANQTAKPLVIHARNAFADTVRLLEEEKADWGKVVFHCFAEGPDEMAFLRQRGAFASFTGVLTYKNAEKTRLACLAQGADRLMLETDCPYLTPVPLRGKTNEPAYLTHTGRFAAGLFQMPPEELAMKTTACARDFYGIEQ